jgi:hypothetical protein
MHQERRRKPTGNEHRRQKYGREYDPAKDVQDFVPSAFRVPSAKDGPILGFYVIVIHL